MTHKHFQSVLALIFIICMFSSSCSAQKALDVLKYRLIYEHQWEFDTVSFNDKREDIIITDVGQNVSKSYSYYVFRADSLKATRDGDVVKRQILRDLIKNRKEPQDLFKGFIRGGMGTKVYKNYPEGHITVTDRISSNHYIYKDDLHAQTWQITDSTKTILEYTCQMAVSDFRGRWWIAWFAHDIPISDGPWKFSGLPGLIMEVHDSEKHFHFTLVGIEQVEDEPIVFSPVVLSYNNYGEYEKTTRIDFLRGLARYRGMASSIMNAELGRETFDETAPSARHNDFMERDYR